MLQRFVIGALVAATLGVGYSAGRLHQFHLVLADIKAQHVARMSVALESLVLIRTGDRSGVIAALENFAFEASRRLRRRESLSPPTIPIDTLDALALDFMDGYQAVYDPSKPSKERLQRPQPGGGTP